MMNQLRPIVRATLFVFSATLLIWAFAPALRVYATGFMLGMVISLINAWILMVKIEALSRNIVEKSDKRVGLGFISRICTALIAVMIAVKLPQVDLVFTIIGLFFVQMATLLMGLFFNRE